MPTLVLLLSLVAPSVNPPLNLLIGSARPEEGGLYFFGGSSVGSRGGSWLGCGWEFAAGGRLAVANNCVTYREIQYENESYRLSYSVGTDLGARQEWYLGHGLVSVLDIGLGGIIWSVVWYPTDFMSLSYGHDLLGGGVRWGWWWTPAR